MKFSSNQNKSEQITWLEVGYVAGPRGLAGEVFLRLGDTSWLKQGLVLRLVPGAPRPGGLSPAQKSVTTSASLATPLELKIERLTDLNGKTAVKFAGVFDRAGAERLQGCKVHAPEILFTSKKGSSIYLSEILGFDVFDGEILVGQIVGFETNGPQDILRVVAKTNEQEPEAVSASGAKRPMSGSKNEVLIPLVKEFIVKIDSQKRALFMSLPPGLIEVNHEN